MKYIKGSLLILLMLVLSACEHRETNILKIGISPWPGYEPLALAAQKGFYGDAKIRIIRFASPTESYRALRDGLIDVAAFTADEVFHFAEVRDKPRIFLIIDISNGGDAIVAKPEIKSLDDLKGKRVGLEESALGHYVINRSLDFAKKLKISDMKLIPVDIGDHTQAYTQGKIDAVVTYEPSKSMLINAGAHVLFDSTQIPNEIVDVLVANDHTIKEKSESLSALLNGWFKALKYIKYNQATALKEMAKNEDISLEEFKTAFQELVIPTKEDNLVMLAEDGTLFKPLDRLSELMYKQNSLHQKIDVRPLLDDRMLKALKK